MVTNARRASSSSSSGVPCADDADHACEHVLLSLGQTEIRKFDHVVLVDQAVGQLQIAMNDTSHVQEVDASSNVQQDLQLALQRQTAPLPRHVLRQRAMLAVLQFDADAWLLQACAKEEHNVRVAQRTVTNWLLATHVGRHGRCTPQWHTHLSRFNSFSNSLKSCSEPKLLVRNSLTAQSSSFHLQRKTTAPLLPVPISLSW
jgi:hypothetical protein